MSHKMLDGGWRGLLPKGPDERGELSFGSSVVGYAILMVTTIALAFGGEFFFGISPERSIYVTMGGVFILAAIGVPRRLYLTIRMVRWFSLIRDPRVMRGLLLLLGVALVLLGVLASDGDLAS